MPVSLHTSDCSSPRPTFPQLTTTSFLRGLCPRSSHTMFCHGSLHDGQLRECRRESSRRASTLTIFLFQPFAFLTHSRPKRQMRSPPFCEVSSRCYRRFQNRSWKGRCYLLFSRSSRIRIFSLSFSRISSKSSSFFLQPDAPLERRFDLRCETFSSPTRSKTRRRMQLEMLG
jgi:hypothetical protein